MSNKHRQRYAASRVSAGELRIGDKVRLSNGNWTRVIGVEKRFGGATVYNFKVADNHNYFVTLLGLLVHNDCWSKTGSKTGAENAYAHWQKHKAEFPEYQNATQYAKGAKDFTQNPPSTAMTKVRPNGDTVIYDPESGKFAVKTSTDVPKTMFKPDPLKHKYPTNTDYFNAQ